MTHSAMFLFSSALMITRHANVQPGNFVVLKSHPGLTLESTSHYLFSFYWAASSSYTSGSCILAVSFGDLASSQVPVTVDAAPYEYQEISVPLTGLEDFNLVNILLTCESATVDFFFDDFKFIVDCNSASNPPGDNGGGGDGGSGGTPACSDANLFNDPSVEGVTELPSLWFDNYDNGLNSGSNGAEVAKTGDYLV